MEQLLRSVAEQVKLNALVDIGITALLIYWLFSLIRGTRAVSLVIGVTVLFAVYAAARFFGLQLLTQILQAGAVVGLFALVVVFQPELRRALERIGRVGSFNWLLSPAEQRAVEHVADDVAHAAALLSADGHGALIVLERDTGLEEVAETGVMIHADISADLLRTIFSPRTPLHDGAVIIRDEMILAAGALLPLAEMTVHTERFGTRHRAALGITEQTDAVVIVGVRGERPDQPRRAGPDRSQPQRAAARPGGPLAPRPGRRPRTFGRRPLPGAGGRAPRLTDLSRLVPRRRTNDAPSTGGRSDDDIHGSRYGQRPAVRRLVGIIVHNWPLKVAAVVSPRCSTPASRSPSRSRSFPAASRSTRSTSPRPPAWRPPLPQATNIRYLSISDPGARASTDSFQATVDLKNVDPNGAPAFVPVNVQSVDPRFQVVSWEPPEVRVTLDPIKTRTGIPVKVVPGPTPSGLDVREAVVTPETASVTGPASIVDQVARVEANVAIDASGLDVDQDVELIPVDNVGDRLTPVDVDPTTAHVTIAVFKQTESRPLPVTPVISGAPAAATR
jgi:diadenylate cyclase